MKYKPENRYSMEFIEEDGKTYVLFYDSNDYLIAKREITRQDATEEIRLDEENNWPMDEEFFFLIGINEDKDGNTVNLMTTPEKWKRLLTTARANGWRPMGTVLDVEFQLTLELSMIEESCAVNIDDLRKQVEERCKRWQGVYQIPQYQIVTAEDAMGMKKAMEGTDADTDLLLFLSKGAFRIAG